MRVLRYNHYYHKYIGCVCALGTLTFSIFSTNKESAYTLNTCKGKGKKIGNAAAAAQQLKPNNIHIHTQEKKQDNLERKFNCINLVVCVLINV